jgi:uncharacterized protein
VEGRERLFSVLVLLTLLVLTAVSLPWVGRVESQYSFRQFFPKNSQLLDADSETRQKFFLGQTQPLLVLMTLDRASSGDWIETKHLQSLADATVEFKKIEGVTSALSLGVVPTTSQGDDQLAVGSVLEIRDENKRRQHILSDRLLNPTMISADARRTLMVLNLEDGISTERVDSIAGTVKSELKARFADAAIEVGGVPAIQSHLSGLVKDEVLRFMSLALVACGLVLVLVFSSLWSLLVPFMAIIVANIFVLAFMAIAGISMTVLAVTIPILVSVTVLSLCIHTSLRLSEELHQLGPEKSTLQNRAQIVVRTFRALFLPNLLTSLTTCFGFATLMLTDVPVIHDFGVTVAVAVMVSWLVSTLVMAPFYILFAPPQVREWMLKEAQWASFIFRKRRALIALVGGGALVMVFVGQNLHWSARLFDDLPAHEEARRATEAIDQGLGGTIPYEIVVSEEGVEEPWNDPAALQNLDRLINEMRTIPEVGSVVGLPDLMRFALGGDGHELPKTRGSVAENWFLIAMGEDSPLKTYLTPNGSAMRIGLRLRDVAGDQMNSVMNKLRQMTSVTFPNAKITTAGMATTVHRMNDELSLSLMAGFWQALAVIAGLLFVVFRSWRWTLLAVLPNLVPAAVLIGVLAIAKTPIKPGVALVFSIALGIAFNNTVYLLQRLKMLMEESGRSAEELIEKTLQAEGNPCLVASSCLIAGFAIFLASEFGINQTFGIYMLISLLFGVVGDLAFLPALVKSFPGILQPANLGSTLRSGRESLIILNGKMQGDDMTNKANAKNQTSIAASFIGAMVILTAFSGEARGATSNGTPDANTILKKVEGGLSSKDESALIKMKVVESNGAAKDREVEIKRKSGAKSQVLVRLKSPSDVSGVALLSVAEGSSEDQWLYMPSQKKARRVVSSNKSQRFLDTEFSLEDFSASTYARFENKLVREDRQPSSDVAVIESKAKAGNDSSYSKIMTWVDLSNYQVQKSDYYGKDGKLLKTMVFRDYKKFGPTWRAQTVEVRNMQNSRSTILKIANLKLNSGLNDREFTQSALEE